ncbi:putative MATE family efflux protein [Catalinimonas alkaloidigena]|uniref:MATE family efflux transporter n=1 Tax=Catalinimonas alkaloidigena TaxID=1075417 RepID=UPI002407505D|nr:MATE family efflux transporter [Catalinimonas alkaloidigena]MDF9794897.1 putative MATE family efflux protein [Catalinimonas alkaloidigena]
MRVTKLLYHFRHALEGDYDKYTSGSIRKAVFYLAVPMILEMIMESLFAIVDIFFVGRLGVNAVATVGLTESVVTIVYSIGIGFSMAATAVISRRVGEKRFDKASSAAFQVILLGAAFSILISITGYLYGAEVLTLMGASEGILREGTRYTQIIFAGNISIMLLFIINGAFRGAGNAAIAMRTLWIANGINIFLDPLLIFGLWIIPGMGIEGAAWATTIGRSIGVLYQLYHLVKGSTHIKLDRQAIKLRWKTVLNIIKVSSGGMGQFLIDSASWIFLTRIVSEFGSVALAGYTIAFRIVMFTLLPAWGLSNAAATMVGQNLGAKHPERAEKSVWYTAKYNVYFLGFISVLFLFTADIFVNWFSPEAEVVKAGATALKIFCLGYIFFAFGMVIVQAFNGAGDTRTPTIINLGVLWAFQLPLAYLLAIYYDLGALGVYITIAISHSLHALVSLWIFRKGKWKEMKV